MGKAFDQGLRCRSQPAPLYVSTSSRISQARKEATFSHLGPGCYIGNADEGSFALGKDPAIKTRTRCYRFETSDTKRLTKGNKVFEAPLTRHRIPRVAFGAVPDRMAEHANQDEQKAFQHGLVYRSPRAINAQLDRRVETPSLEL